ncbi:MAG TPA: ABC transporter ATP-binding protein [Ruminococcus sp.]|nr:ABC transporter ATP-binding protein [Ruminococcus sp.]
MKHNAWKWLWRVTGTKKCYVFVLMLTECIYGASGVLYALLLRNIVDNAAAGARAGFIQNALLTALLVLVQVLLRAASRHLEELSRSTLENIFKSRLLHMILQKDYAAVSAVHSGEWLNRLTNDCAVAANHYTEILPGIAGMGIKLASAAVMLTVLDYRFAAILIPLGCLLLLLTYVFRKSLKQLHKRIQEADGSLRIFLQERIGSMMMLRSYAAERPTEQQAAEKMKAHQSARMRKNRFSNLCNVGFQGGMQGMYLLGVCYCGYGILTGTISYGTLTAVTQLISQIQSPFANITGYLPKYYAMTASAERLMEAERLADDCDRPTRSADEIAQYYRSGFAAIGLRDAAFTYLPAVQNPEQDDQTVMPLVLDGISMEIRKGEYAAFTGHSGCGKSTVLKLLMCIYKPDAGERYVRDRAGEMQPLDASWHRLFAYVPQGNQLMCGTIREIVAFAEPDAAQDAERIRLALQVACADAFVSELENGIDTQLGERGTGLSEGQMQRIAIARAVFSGSPILMLDEATSALDDATERQVLENLRKMTDKTVLIVTHRPAALHICDTIYEFTEDGICRKEQTNGSEQRDVS